MSPRKRRVGRVKATIPPTSTHGVNTCGFATLPDEIYLEIVSYLPSVPIPTQALDSKWQWAEPQHYPRIRRSRHETLLSLTQTSRSLRRFFWRYLWQRIEVREGMKIGDKEETLKDTRTPSSHKKYALELVRQLEIVTIRNPQLAQYINYLDIFIGEYSAKTVLPELARCLSLFENLHTVQIDVDFISRRSPLMEIFEQTFKKYSYPQIRNVFIMPLSSSFVASCPQVRRAGFTRNCSMLFPLLKIILHNCPHLEVLEDIGFIIWSANICDLIVNNCPNLHIIQFSIFHFDLDHDDPSSHINILMKLDHLQTIIMRIASQILLTERVKEYWIESAKDILIDIQLRDNLEKTVVMLEDDGNERRILLKPKSSASLAF